MTTQYTTQSLVNDYHNLHYWSHPIYYWENTFIVQQNVSFQGIIHPFPILIEVKIDIKFE